LLPFGLFVFGICLQFLACTVGSKVRRRAQLRKVNNWVCVYVDSVAIEDIKKFNLAVLDADAHPDLAPLRGSSTLPVGYLSLGEIADYRWYWDLISTKSWVLDKNPNWGSHFVDVRQKEWHSFLLDIVIPEILGQGFEGLFLDTIDSAEYLEKYHHKKYPGSEKAMAELIRAIRKRYPKIYLIANRGYSIVGEIGGEIDALLAESTFTTIDFKNETVEILRPPDYDPVVSRLKIIQKQFNLTILTLDYVAAEKTVVIQSILSLSRDSGFIPYVSTPALDTVFFHNNPL